MTVVAVGYLHQREEMLAVHGIGHAKRCAVDDRGMRVQHLLRLARIDVHTAAHDELGRPVGDVEVAVGVEVANVAARDCVADRRPRAVTAAVASGLPR